MKRPLSLSLFEEYAKEVIKADKEVSATGYSVLLDELMRTKRADELKIYTSGLTIDPEAGLRKVVSGTTDDVTISAPEGWVTMSVVSSPSPKYYTGIGSRETPPETLAFMRFLGWYLAQKDWVLRSGGADGADAAFEEGCDSAGGKKEIFLPWKGFNDHKSRYYATNEAINSIAAKHHPAWNRLTEGGKKLHARNVRQVLGKAAYPESAKQYSEFVVCWTKDGKGRGGTGQAIRIARAYGVPVFDLGIHGADYLEVEELGEIVGGNLMLEFEAWRSG